MIRFAGDLSERINQRQDGRWEVALHMGCDNPGHESISVAYGHERCLFCRVTARLRVHGRAGPKQKPFARADSANGRTKSLR